MCAWVWALRACMRGSIIGRSLLQSEPAYLLQLLCRLRVLQKFKLFFLFSCIYELCVLSLYYTNLKNTHYEQSN